MDWSKLGEKVADYAPLLGGALGPGGAAIGSLIASAFGTENTPEAIVNHINQNPQDALKLKDIELKHQVRLEELAIERLGTELKDKQNARANHSHSRMPAVLSLGLTVLIAVLIFLLFFVEVPQGSREVLFVMLGAAMKAWDNSMQYWFGTTRSSAEKSKLMGK